MEGAVILLRRAEGSSPGDHIHLPSGSAHRKFTSLSVAFVLRLKCVHTAEERRPLVRYDPVTFLPGVFLERPRWLPLPSLSIRVHFRSLCLRLTPSWRIWV